MTKHLHRLATEIQRRLLAGGGASPLMSVADRDAWASLYRWHTAGEKLWRIEDTAGPVLAPTLALAAARVHAAAICYTGPQRQDWIVVARHVAQEPVQIYGDQVFAFSDPTITYFTVVDDKGTGASGHVNLIDQPTWADLYLAPGTQGSRWLQQDDIAVEEARFLRAMRQWYCPPAIALSHRK